MMMCCFCGLVCCVLTVTAIVVKKHKQHTGMLHYRTGTHSLCCGRIALEICLNAFLVFENRMGTARETKRVQVEVYYGEKQFSEFLSYVVKPYSCRFY
jgi:hypothetical protein